MSVINAVNIHKSFKIYYDKSPTLKEKIIFKNRNRHEVHHVLKGIDLHVEKGEAVGLIGENGSGKSTLLKLLTRIIFPDEGTIRIKGKVSSLLELGAGFHPDMTGRENIYMNASIFGLNRREIDRRVETIIDFSELGEFVDNPVRTYSSGMYMRLAFSVAINVDADILLIDEILAVGDANFQAKCFSKLREIKASGTTIVIVSHSMGQIEQICDRCIWIAAGVIKMEGSPYDVTPAYLEFMGQKRHGDHAAAEAEVEKPKEEKPENEEDGAEEKKQRWGNGAARIQKVTLTDSSGQEKDTFRTGEKFVITIYYTAAVGLQNPAVGIGIFRNDGVQCYGTNTFIDRIRHVALQPQGKIVCEIFENTLLAGDYSLDIAIHAEDGFAYDYCKGIASFKMYSELSDAGIMRLQHKWAFEQ